jgi:hypothetical protein
MIIALQYYEGDLEPTMSLARLLADLEPVPRTDVVLALVCHPGTPVTPLTKKTIAHCERRFVVEHVVSPLGAKGHPEACTALWAGTMQHYYERFKCGELSYSAVLALDGGDGVPLHKDWLSMLKVEHEYTLSVGKLITGTPYWLGGCPLLVNPNAVFELSVLNKTSFITDIPKYDGTLLTNFDIYHRRDMLANASLSTAVRTDWHGCGKDLSIPLMKERATEAFWLHGYKDAGVFATARQYLFGGDTVRPELRRYDLAQLYLEESVRQRNSRRRA